MTTASMQVSGSTARLRAGIGVAGMFVVACFGLALFFKGEQSQAAETLAETSENAQVVQVADAQ